MLHSVKCHKASIILCQKSLDMLLLPNGCFQKRPQAHLALRALKHLFIIFLHPAGGLPGRISKKYNMQKLPEMT